MDNAIRSIINELGNGLFVYSLIVVLISVVLGGLIGFEREFNGHAAGLRTHIVISLAATMIGIIGSANQSWAPYLLTAVIISLGFLSAGSIIQTGKDVRGITTSSTVWITGIIGVAVGFGYIAESLLLTIVTLIALVALSYAEKKTSKRDPTVTLIVGSDANIADEIVRIASTYGLKIRNISSKISKYKSTDAVSITVMFFKAPSETIKAFGDELQVSINPMAISVKVPRV